MTTTPGRWRGRYQELMQANANQQKQLPQGSSFPLPSMWTLAPSQQHLALPKVKLPPFWPKDPNSWFTLAESTFNRHNMVDSRLRFDLVMRAIDHLDCPYMDLKARLLRLLTPKPADICLKLIHGGELRKGGPPS